MKLKQFYWGKINDRMAAKTVWASEILPIEVFPPLFPKFLLNPNPPPSLERHFFSFLPLFSFLKVPDEAVPTKEIEVLFPASKPKTISNLDKPKKETKPKTITLIDPQRGNNLSIVLSQFKMTGEQIASAICDVNNEVTSSIYILLVLIAEKKRSFWEFMDYLRF